MTFFRKVVSVFCFFFFPGYLLAQKADSIYFNLYTDSLKKGTFNYINVEGRINRGKILPLSARDLIFSATTGKFNGNSLFLEPSSTVEKVEITATLRNDSTKRITTILFVKRLVEN